MTQFTQGLELAMMYVICNLENKDGKFYDKETDSLANGKKIGYQKKLFGLVTTKQVRAEMSFKEGVHDGPMNLWYRNGNKWFEFNYSNGKEHGICKRWFENGTLEEEREFDNGEILKQKLAVDQRVLDTFLNLYKTQIQANPIIFDNEKVDLSDEITIITFFEILKKIAKTQIEISDANAKRQWTQLIDYMENDEKEIINYLSKNI